MISGGWSVCALRSSATKRPPTSGAVSIAIIVVLKNSGEYEERQQGAVQGTVGPKVAFKVTHPLSSPLLEGEGERRMLQSEEGESARLAAASSHVVVQCPL